LELHHRSEETENLILRRSNSRVPTLRCATKVKRKSQKWYAWQAQMHNIQTGDKATTGAASRIIFPIDSANVEDERML